MNKIITTTLAVLVALSLNAQEVINKEPLFDKNEVSLGVLGEYSKQNKHQWGGALALTAFPLQKYAGLEVSTSVDNVENTFLENVQYDAVIRIPFEVQRLSLGIKGGANNEIGTDNFRYGVGPVLEYRLNKNWGVRGEYRYVFEDGDQRDENRVRFGLSLIF